MTDRGTIVQRIYERVKIYAAQLQVFIRAVKRSLDCNGQLITITALCGMFTEMDKTAKRMEAASKKPETLRSAIKILDDTFKPERMKAVFYYAVSHRNEARYVFSKFPSDYELIQLLREDNAKYMGHKSDLYVTPDSYPDMIDDFFVYMLAFIDQLKALELTNGDRAIASKFQAGITEVMQFISTPQPMFRDMSGIKYATVPYDMQKLMDTNCLLGKQKFHVHKQNPSTSRLSQFSAACGQGAQKKVQLYFTSDAIAIRHIVPIPKYLMDSWECMDLRFITVAEHPELAYTLKLETCNQEFYPDFKPRDYVSLESDKFAQFFKTLQEMIHVRKNMTNLECID